MFAHHLLQILFSHTRWRPLAVALAVGGLTVAPAQAQEGWETLSPFRFSGFGTISRSWDSHNDLTLIRDISQRPRGDYADGPTSRLDSRMGLQFAYRFSERVEAVAQVTARYQESTEFHHYVDLGYLDIRPTEAARLRFGRVGYDAFLMSDHRHLGYAYAWVRPPIEFYSWIPAFSVDGGDVTYAFAQDDAHWQLRAQAGKSDFVAPMGASPFNFHADKLWSVSLQREAGPWKLKAALSGFTSSKEVEALSSLHAGLQQIAGLAIPGISGEAAYLSEQSRFKDIALRYFSLGAAYDDGTWFGQAELSSVRTENTFVPQTDNGYAVIGRRFGTWSPFVMLGMSRPDRKLLKPTNDWSPLGAGAAGLQATTYQQIVNSTRFDQETLSLGTRWDVHPRAAIKLQWDHTKVNGDGYAAWFRTPGYLPRDRSSSVNLFTISMDFVF
jgi:hypothetical protein